MIGKRSIWNLPAWKACLLGLFVLSVWQICPAALVAYYPFDGDFSDALGDADKDFQPGTGYSQPGFTAGLYGQAASFDGIDDFAVTTSFLTGDLSIVFWIKTLDSYNLGMKEFWNGKGIVNAEIPGCAYDIGDWGICLQATDKAGFGIGTVICEDTIDVLSTTPINDGQWRFICCTRDGTTGEFSVYVDAGGPEDSRVLSPAYPLQPVPMYLASTNEESGKFLNGALDDLMFFDHVLTQREIDLIRELGILYGPAVAVYPQPLPDPGGYNVPSGSTFQWYSGYSGPGVVDRYTLRIDSEAANLTDPNESGMGDYLVWQEDILPQSPADSNAFHVVYGIQDNTTYYWRVDTLVLDPNVTTGFPEVPHWIEGPVWSFRGASALPTISEPNSTVLLPNINTHEIDTPQLSFTSDIVASFDVQSIEWFKDGQPLTIDDIKYSILNSPSLSAAESSTLTIHNPGESDEGEYACKVTLVNGFHATGPAARLDVASEVLIHRWSFNQAPGESTVTDFVGGANGTLIDPNNNTLDFDGAGQLAWGNPNDPNRAAWVELPANLLSDLPDHLTLMAWYTWNDPQYRSLAPVFSAGQQSFLELITKDASGRIRFQSEQAAPPGSASAIGGLAQESFNQEVCIAVVWDGAAGHISLYQDGGLRDTAPINMALTDLNDVDIWLGRSRWSSHPFFIGSLNELRIYNIPLSAPWIEALTELGPDGEAEDPEIVNPCVLPIANGADINGDCKVDLADFAVMAASWLECGLVSCL